jgi:hypothetical protein
MPPYLAIATGVEPGGHRSNDDSSADVNLSNHCWDVPDVWRSDQSTSHIFSTARG